MVLHLGVSVVMDFPGNTKKQRTWFKEIFSEEDIPHKLIYLKADDDAIHIAIATIYGLDYLLTWNCKHIANAQIQKKLAQISSNAGYELPTIFTPYEFMGV
jgi:hypothetical protein